jgi:hypothetical protein
LRPDVVELQRADDIHEVARLVHHCHLFLPPFAVVSSSPCSARKVPPRPLVVV